MPRLAELRRRAAGVARPVAPRYGERWGFATLAAALLVFQAYVIFVQPHGTPATTGEETHVLDPIAGAATLRQSFRPNANGLDRLTFYLAPGDASASGQVVFELFDVSEGETTDQPLFRLVRSARDVARGETYALRFHPIDDTSGKTLAIQVSVPGVPASEGLRLLATRHDRYPGGRLWVDGREQWGDLVFRTHAERATAFARFEHALRTKPAWLRSRVTLGLLFALYNVALLTVLWTVWTAPEPADADVSHPARPHSVRWRLVAAAAVAAALAAGYYAFVPRRAWLEWGAVELIDRFPEAVKRTTMPVLSEGFREQDVVVGTRRMRCLFAHGTSRIVWRVDVAEHAEFRVSAGMRPDVWEGPGDGVTFRVGFSDGVTYEERYRTNFYPLARPDDRRFVPLRFDLAKYAGKRVEVILNTEESMNAVGDAAMWCEPRIVTK